MSLSSAILMRTSPRIESADACIVVVSKEVSKRARTQACHKSASEQEGTTRYVSHLPASPPTRCARGRAPPPPQSRRLGAEAGSEAGAEAGSEAGRPCGCTFWSAASCVSIRSNVSADVTLSRACWSAAALESGCRSRNSASACSGSSTCVENSRPEASAHSPSSTSRHSARSSSGRPTASASLGQLWRLIGRSFLAGRPYRPCYPQRAAPRGASPPVQRWPAHSPPPSSRSRR
eukprot:scaffold44018_cov70-Phaeocystis_antarctica.AAC.5